MQLSKWVLLASVLLMVIALGFFLPPLKAAGFDLSWFGVLMLLAVLLICIFPGIATGLPDLVMGVAAKPH